MSGEQRLLARTTRLVALGHVAASGAAALVVFVFLGVLLPAPSAGNDGRSVTTNAILLAVYLPLTGLAGRRWGTALARPRLRWLQAARAPDRAEQRAALRLPLVLLVIPATFWVLGGALFAVVNSTGAGETAGRVATAAVLGALTSCALTYLVTERLNRPIARLALAAGPLVRPAAPGVVLRLLLAWALGTGVPVVAIGLTALGVLTGDTPANRSTAGSVLFLAVVGLVAGALGIGAAARSIAEPVGEVRAGLARVEAGDVEAEVAVYDASEVGSLQVGFNRMAAGLRERERLRELFGLHVEPDVARRALEEGVELGGELREAAVLFVDVQGSTALAAKRPPTEVVDRLNAFFGAVVAEAAGHGGWVNKFEGDAALCVFGVPVAVADAAASALAAGRALRDRLADPNLLPAAIGISAGRVVAGNIGAADRLEYTVIGDPVNEAARLTELAKERPERILAAEAAVARAGGDEARRWRQAGAQLLRGRTRPTPLYVPNGGA